MTGLVISPPSNKYDTGECLSSSWYFLITGLPQDVASALIKLAVCSTAELTVFFTPFEQPLPTYICTIENMMYLDFQESNIAIVNLIHTTITATPGIASFMHSRLITPDAQAAIDILGSLYVSTMTIAISTDDLCTVWNVYCCKPPNLSFEDFHTWCNLI